MRTSVRVAVKATSAASLSVTVIAATIIGLAALRFAQYVNVCVAGVQFGVSYEIWDGKCHGSRVEAVSDFVSEHISEFRRASQRFNVDVRLLMLDVSYEAMTNIHYGSYFGLTRSVGLGKVHYKQFLFQEGDPVSKEVEVLGLLPLRDMEGRRALLSTVPGALNYISAINRAYINLRGPNLHVACDPTTLLSLYTSSDLVSELQSILRTGPRIANAPNLNDWVSRKSSWIDQLVHNKSAMYCNKLNV